MSQPLSSHRYVGTANIFIDKKGNRKRSIASMPKKSLAAADINDNGATDAGDARGGAQVAQSATPDSITDSLFEGGSLPASPRGSPSTRVVSKEAEKLAEQERRQQLRKQERKRQWQQSKESVKTGDDERLQTHTQVSRTEENKRRRFGDDFQKRAPTALMAATVSRRTASTNSPGLFVGQSRSESLESGEIAKTKTSIGKTNGRSSLLDRVVMPSSSPEPDVPRSLKGKQTAPTGRVATNSEPQERSRSPVRPFFRSTSSEESDSADEPDSGVPACTSDPSIRKYQPMFAKRTPTVDVSRQKRESIARPGGRDQATEQSQSVSHDAKPDMTKEGTETQRYQEIVNSISAGQEAADPDVDPAVAGNLGEGPGIALSRSRRALSGSMPETTEDVIMHQADHVVPQMPANGTVDPTIEPPSLIVKLPYKKNGRARPRDSGWRFQHLKGEGRRQRMTLIKGMEGEWGRPVASVVPRDLWPRSIEVGGGVELPKEPRNWSHDLLKNLRELSKTTAGNPGLAEHELRKAVKLQVAKHGGSPVLCKDDVQFAEQLLHSVVGEAFRSRGPGDISTHGKITVESHRPPMQDRTGDIGHTTRSDRHQSSAPGSRESVAIRIPSTPPREELGIPIESAAERVSNLLDGPVEAKAERVSYLLDWPVEAKAEPGSYTLDAVAQEAAQPEAAQQEATQQEAAQQEAVQQKAGQQEIEQQNERDMRPTLPSSPQRATPQTASASQPPGKLPMTKQQKLLIEEYKLARLRRDLLANDIDPDSI